MRLAAGIALLSLLLAFTGYGSPYPFMGSLYLGEAAQRLAFADTMICLYLFIGVVKRQRLTLWLLLAYNLLDLVNAWVNLALIPMAEYARLSDVPVPDNALLGNTVFASILLILFNLYLVRNRALFDNRSPYLF